MYGLCDCRVLEWRVIVVSFEFFNYIIIELVNNGSIFNGNECNIVEFIDFIFGCKF